ncbi:MAG TPA: hypothetical protein VFL92_13380 [Sphingomonas sp.]|nr:hypothetical protein [Sphingomonas sp.]
MAQIDCALIEPFNAIGAAEPLPLSSRAASWLRWLGPGISAAILLAVAYQLRSLDLATIKALVPRTAAFWLVFVVYYLAMPVTEWMIFRRLWRIPLTGIIPLLRKMIGNEIVVGYIGEVYFYAWARRRANLVGAPFGAIKDVSILSALIGNAFTIALLAIAYPALGMLHLGIRSRALYLSIGIVLLTSLALMLFRRRLFSLPAADLRFIAAAHAVRVVGKMALAALLWHLALPAVALVWWLVLSTLRQLLSRLPLLPNKDIAFAGLAVFLIGHDLQIGALMTMIASVTLAVHLAVGGLLSLGEFATPERASC